ncbi:gmp synthase [Colletotrichum incanum]|uniref:Gmp synthase n=1 Tax=Colletotrichum incanum TaxID=1573173 RepID=A0A167B0J1_COLIC|nr:gmp synthase [Colletotrichum incanum]
MLAIQQRGEAPVAFSLPRNRRHARPGWSADREDHHWRQFEPPLAFTLNARHYDFSLLHQRRSIATPNGLTILSNILCSESSSTMSNFGNFMKNGWHPEKAGTTFKGQVNGLLGRNKDDADKEGRVARPLSSLQDPSTFAPPPKRVPGTNPPPPPPSRSNAASPGAPPPPYEDPNRYQQQEEEEEEAPPRPYRVDTTGLSTAHLPPPPGRKDGADGRTPPPGQAAARPPPPSLPPRLPPRTPSAASVTPPAPPASAASSGGGYLNQNAMSRLGAAGVSVPALGIGKSAPEPPARSNAGSPAPPPRNGAFSPPNGQMNELQNRFAKLGKSSGQLSSPPPPSEGTTMEQKQAALRTASNFHKNPSSVSMSDARSAASTFNNFRQRHGEQVASGVKSANNLNQKYGISDKVGKYAGQVGQQQEGTTGNAGAAPSPLSPPPGLLNTIGKKKPPPPPPKKKPQLSSAAAPPAPGPGDDDEPPPIPLATKPTF